MRFALFVFLLLSHFASIYSQATIQGTLKSEKKIPISGASVTITAIDNSNVISYDISDSEGNFSISLPSTIEKLQINIRSLGYKPLEESVLNKSQVLDFMLEEDITALDEVILKNSPITRKGDTINYVVKSFANQKDRTISDVLKNLPGIEVLESGKILYQGKPIIKYYIEGLDLLEGKYNLANENLPYQEVSKVQVLENHQPIKILDSLLYSDDTAINIKLKNKIVFTGQAEIGSGLSPILWDANVTPILVSKKNQLLSSYQANNTGDNVGLQLKTITIDELLEQFERNEGKRDWLFIELLPTPNFSERRWLNNNVHLITANNLQKLKNDYEIRFNASYLNDFQQQNGFTNTQYFTPVDTITIFENKQNSLFVNTLEANLTLQKNTTSNYLKNDLRFQGFWDNQKGIIQLDSTGVNQDLDNRYFKLSNNLKTLFPLGKQIATLFSYIGASQTPQNLVVQPGQFNELINNGNPSNETIQNLDLRTFYTNNAIGFTKGYGKFSFSPKLGFQFEKQNLESRLGTSNQAFADASFNNNLDWTRSKFYFDIKTQYRKDKFLIELATPFNLHTYNLEDVELQENQDLNRLTFEPRLSIKYDLNPFLSIKGIGNLRNPFGAIQEVYYGYILQNYRNIQRIDAPLPQQQKRAYTLSISYRKPISSFFFNATYNNTTTDNNLLYSNQILENGAKELLAIEQDNRRYSQNVSARVSNYFNGLNTTFSVGGNYGFQKFLQVINSEITAINNRSLQLKSTVDTEIFDWIDTELEANWQFSNNEIQGENNQTIVQKFYKFNLNIYPSENQFIGFNTEYIRNNLFSDDFENVFGDLIYRYTWKKKNIDFEIQWNNVFNTENYRTINVNEFTYIATNFRLRPSQVLFKIRFSL